MTRVRRAARQLVFIAAVSMATWLFAAPAFAWQVWYTSTSASSTTPLLSTPEGGDWLADIPLVAGGSVWSDGSTQLVTGAGSDQTWLRVCSGGVWGWATADHFAFSGAYTAVPYAAPVSPRDGAAVSEARPLLVVVCQDPDGASIDAVEVQIAQDGDFASVLWTGSALTGTCRPAVDLRPGVYSWRARSHSALNGWGGWTNATFRVARVPAVVSTPKVAKTVRTGSRLTVSGTVTPAHAAGSRSVLIACYWRSSAKKRWTLRKIESATISDDSVGGSAYSLRFKNSSKSGTWAFRAMMPDDESHSASGWSRFSRSVKVLRRSTVRASGTPKTTF